MAEVGVLNLTIKDNSEKAGQGLSSLAGALTAVKDALNGFNLSPVGQQVTALAKTIQEAKGTSTIIKNLGSMFNAINQFSKIKSFTIDTDKIRSMAENMLKLADAKDRVDEATRSGAGVSDWRSGMMGISNATKDTVTEVTEQTEKLDRVLTSFQRRIGKDAPLQIFGGRGTKKSEGQIAMDLEGLQKSSVAISDTAEKTKEFNAQMSELAHTEKAVDIDKLGMPFYQVGVFLENAIPSMIKFGSLYERIIKNGYTGQTPESMMLSTNVEKGAGWKPNWAYYDPKVAEAMAEQQQLTNGLLQQTDSILEKTTESARSYASGASAAATESGKLSSAQDKVAQASAKATAQIKKIFSVLDKPMKYKGLSEIVDVVTGVKSGSQGQNIINEETTMLGAIVAQEEALERTKSAISETTDAQVKLNEAGRAYAGVVTVFDEASGSFKRMYADTSKVTESVTEAKTQTEDSVSSIKNFIDLTKVPASGKNGVFANAAEEVSYLTSKVEEAKLGMQQFDSIEANAAKQMKYGGPMKPDELAFNLQHATEGFYQYAEAEQYYQRAIDDALDHAQKYVTEMSQMADQSAATEPLKAAMDQLGTTAKDTSNDGLEAFKNELQDIANSTEPALSKIDLLRNKVGFLEEKLARLYEMPATDELGMDTGRNNAINETLLKIGAVNEQIQKLIDKSHEAQQAMQFENMKASAANEISQRTPWTAEDVSNIVNYYSQIELLEMKMQGMQDALARDIDANKLDTQQIADRAIAIQNLKDKIEELKHAQDETTESTKTFGLSFKDFKKNLKSAFPLLSQLGSRLKSIIIRRTLTAALRKVVSGAKEGLQNVYEYSKAIGSSFAPSMDSAASSLATMKNALGAALAPAVQALIPVLQSVVNWFINLVNQVNQFFALLNGQKTWTRAVPQTVSAFDKQEKAAKKAGAAIKDLLADWDELNIIQSNTSGAGSGAGTSAAEDYLNMFEEVNTFDRKVKDVVDFIKDNFDSILKVVEGIGAAILLWKISEAFGHSLGMLQKLELAAGLTLIISGIKMTADAGYDIGKNGINDKNALEAVGGVLETMLGGGLVGLAFGGITGGLIGITVGAALGLAVLAINLEQGHLDSLYGEATKTTEEIVDELKENVLTAEAQLQVDVLSAHVKDVDDAKTKVGTALLDLATNYPVCVEVTPDDAETFKTKVDELVTSTNKLIEERKASMKQIEVPAMAVFGPTFVDDAWGGISSYVTELGTEIGTELSKSTVDAVKLEELKKKLMEMSMVIMNAQKGSEFSGSVGLIGENVRNNTKLGKYNRDTIETYIDEYNSLLKEKMGEAEGFALDEYVSAYTLVESLETKKRQMGKAFDQEGDLENARRVLEEMGEQGEYVAKRAQEYFDAWTKAGRLLYGNDIAGALKLAIANNDRMSSYYGRQLDNDVTPRNSEIKDSDAFVSHYIRDQYKDLYNIISIGSGMSYDSIKELLENTGINPLELLDEDFVSQYREKIISWLGKSSLSDERKKTVLAAFGLDFENVQFQVEEEKTAAENVADAIEDAVDGSVIEPEIKANPQVEIQNDGEFAANLYKEIGDLIDKSGLPEETIEIFRERLDAVKDLQTLKSLKTFIDKNGLTDAMRMLQDYLDTGSWGGKKSGLLQNAAAIIGMSSMSTDYGNLYGRKDNQITRYNPNPSYPYAQSDEGIMQLKQSSQDTIMEMTEADYANAVETGTTRANRDQNDILNAIMRGVDALLRKNWTVNITPSSSLGAVNSHSTRLYGMVTGETE